MKMRYTSVEEQVEYGLETIAPERTVEVSLHDLMFVFQTLGVLVNFFHQDLHYPTLEAVDRFLGNIESGAMHLIHECYYNKMRDMLPEDIEQGFDESRFDNPSPPYYYEPTEKDAI